MSPAGITLIVLGLGAIGYALLDYNQTRVSPWPLVGIGAAIAVVGGARIWLVPS